MAENNQDYKVVYEAPKQVNNVNQINPMRQNCPPQYQANPVNQPSMGQNPNYNYQNGAPVYRQPPFYPNGYVDPNLYQQALFEHQMKVKKAKKDLRFLGNMAGLGLLLFVIINTMLSFVLTIPSVYKLYTTSSLFQSAFSILGSFCYVGLPFLIVALLIKTRDKQTRLLPLKKPNTKNALLCIPIGLAVCFIANIITNIFINVLSLAGVTLTQQSTGIPTPSTIPALLLALLGTAVMPGLMEEYAMRGIVLQPIRKYGMAFAIVSTSVIFGIMHGNLIQAPFAIIVGLGLAFFSIKCNSLWVAVIIHMLNNAFSVVMEYLQNVLSKTAYNISYYISFGIVMGLGLICLILLLTTNKDFMKKSNGDVAKEEATLLSRGQKTAAFFINVPMILGVIYMLICTAAYVKIGK